MGKRSYSKLDQVLIELQRGLTSICADLPGRRPNPAANIPEPQLTPEERRASSQMMRVNHSGEICAQALYFGQMVMAQSPQIYNILAEAVKEETDHLAWTAQRLSELKSHCSYLNFYWYTQSFFIGLLAGLAGDRWSLGFIEETERQVSQHLSGHLNRLPAADIKSRVILSQMREDEQHHGQTAAAAGGYPLPWPIKHFMAAQAKIMTTLAQWF